MRNRWSDDITNSMINLGGIRWSDDELMTNQKYDNIIYSDLYVYYIMNYFV